MLSLCVSFLPPPKWKKTAERIPEKNENNLLSLTPQVLIRRSRMCRIENGEHDLVIGFEWNRKGQSKQLFHLSLFDLNWK